MGNPKFKSLSDWINFSVQKPVLEASGFAAAHATVDAPGGLTIGSTIITETTSRKHFGTLTEDNLQGFSLLRFDSAGFSTFIDASAIVSVAPREKKSAREICSSQVEFCRRSKDRIEFHLRTAKNDIGIDDFGSLDSTDRILSSVDQVLPEDDSFETSLAFGASMNFHLFDEIYAPNKLKIVYTYGAGGLIAIVPARFAIPLLLQHLAICSS